MCRIDKRDVDETRNARENNDPTRRRPYTTRSKETVTKELIRFNPITYGYCHHTHHQLL